jgi:hypothetical protein
MLGYVFGTIFRAGPRDFSERAYARSRLKVTGSHPPINRYLIDGGSAYGRWSTSGGAEMWFWLTIGLIIAACIALAAIYDRRQRHRGGRVRGGAEIQRGIDNRPGATDPGYPEH